MKKRQVNVLWMDLRPVLMASAMLFSGIAACTNDEVQVEEAVVEQDQKLPAELKNQNNNFDVDKDGRVTFEAEIVYFSFDDPTLTDQGKSRLQALAEYLKANPGQKLQVRGHCDERGSTEYNLALGQGRSESVRSYLVNLGIDEGRISTVSFGEEKPAATGHSESAWSQNRRADFILTKG
ncbi:MAG: OmpA family protein [Bdellovibrionota bacterium]